MQHLMAPAMTSSDQLDVDDASVRVPLSCLPLPALGWCLHSFQSLVHDDHLNTEYHSHPSPPPQMNYTECYIFEISQQLL